MIGLVVSRFIGWARAFNFNKTSVGRAFAFACATCCHLILYSLAQPRTGSGGGSRGSFPGASCDHTRRSRSADAAEYDDASPSGCLPSSASHDNAQNICSHHGFSANTGATSNIVPVAVNAIHLDADWDESLDAILDAAALRVDQDGILSNHETVRISTTKVDKVCTFFNLRVFIKE